MKKITQTLICIGATILILMAIYPALGCDCCDECCDKEEKEEESGTAQSPTYIAPTYAPQQGQQPQQPRQ